MSKRSEQLDRNWEAAKADLVEAADKAGIDPGIMATMAGLESQAMQKFQQQQEQTVAGQQESRVQQ